MLSNTTKSWLSYSECFTCLSVYLSIMSTTTAAIDEIHVALSDMTSQVYSQASKLRPAIFPSYLQVDSIFDLCVTKAQRESAQNWLRKKDVDDNNYSDTGFVTTIDYPHRRVTINEVKVSQNNVIKAILYCVPYIHLISLSLSLSYSSHTHSLSVCLFVLKYHIISYISYHIICNHHIDYRFNRRVVIFSRQSDAINGHRLGEWRQCRCGQIPGREWVRHQGHGHSQAHLHRGVQHVICRQSVDQVWQFSFFFVFFVN